MDKYLIAVDGALRTLFAVSSAARPAPVPTHGPATPLDADQRRLSAALMRVNHVGEVCAQALYTAQGLTTRTPGLKAHFEAAAQEENDHLAWTRERINTLGGRVSLLNPLWYAGAFGLGWMAGRLSDRWSLGFVVETEKQVAAHLQSHLDRLPSADAASRAIVAEMQRDEERHAAEAHGAGAQELPVWVKRLMRVAGKVMTTTAHRI